MICHLNQIFHYHSNEVDILKMLIAKGVSLDSQNRSGKTAVYLAVSNQFTECCRLLIGAGCDVNLHVLYLSLLRIFDSFSISL